MFAAEDNQHLGKTLPNNADDLPRHWPEGAEIATETDNALIGGDAFNDLLRRQTLDHQVGSVGIGRNLIKSLTDGVNYIATVAGFANSRDYVG